MMFLFDMVIETLTFQIKDTIYSLSGITITENNIIYSVKNVNTGTFKDISIIQLEKIFKKYDAKFVF